MKLIRLAVALCCAVNALAQTTVTIGPAPTRRLQPTVPWITFPPTSLRLDDTDASNQLIITNGSNMTENRILTLKIGDANMEVDLTGASVGNSLSWNGTKWLPASGSGSGDVVGPSSAVDTAIAVFNGTSGKAIKNSPVTVANTTGAMAWAAGQNASFTAGSSGATLTLGQGTNGNVSIVARGTAATGNTGGQILLGGLSAIDHLHYVNVRDPRPGATLSSIIVSSPSTTSHIYMQYDDSNLAHPMGIIAADGTTVFYSGAGALADIAYESNIRDISSVYLPYYRAWNSKNATFYGKLGIGLTGIEPTRGIDLASTLDVYAPRKSATVGTGSYGGYSFEIRNGTDESINLDIFDRTGSAWYNAVSFANVGGAATFIGAVTGRGTSPQLIASSINGDAGVKALATTTFSAAYQFYNATTGALADIFANNSKQLVLRTNGSTVALTLGSDQAAAFTAGLSAVTGLFTGNLTSAQASGDGQIRSSGSGTNNAIYQFQNVSTGALADIYSNNSKQLIFRTNGSTEALTLGADQTATFSAMATIVPASGDAKIKLLAGTTNNPTIQLYNASTGALGDIFANNSKQVVVRTNGSTTAATFGADQSLAVVGALSASNLSGTNTGDNTFIAGTNVTLTLSGATLTISAAGGGNVTGSSLTANAVIVGNGTTSVGALASLGSSGAPLVSAGAGAPPAFGALDLDSANSVTNTLGVANGGTNLASGNSGGFLAFTGATTMASTATLAAGTVLVGGGVGAVPTASTTTISSGTMNVPTAVVTPTVTLSGAMNSATVNATGTVSAATVVELGHATDTTLARVSAGVMSVEGSTVPVQSATLTSGNIIVGGGTNIVTPSTVTISAGNVSIPGTLQAVGHVTLEGVTSTGASGTGNIVFSRPAYNAQTGTSYTIVAADENKWVTLSNASAITLTINDTANTTIAAGVGIVIEQIGAGLVTVSPQNGNVTINSRGAALKMGGQYAVAALQLMSVSGNATVWTLYGDITP